MSFQGLSPSVVWGLVPRLLGVVYLLAFGALIPQIRALAGKTGFIPVREWLARVRRDFPGPRRFFDYPTLLWLDASEFTIRAMPVLGVICGALAIYGGPIGYIALICAWILWLSLEPVGVIFPWDTLLMEAGFLALFLPAVHPLPDVPASTLPLPTVAFMFRWLVLRLMLGFGKDKFIGADRSDNLYLRGFFVWMPLPTPLGWYLHHAPRWFLKASLGFMFFAEVVAPLISFFTGPLRLVGAAALIGLSVGIHATGNWGFFNVGYALLSLCLLDTQSSVFDLFREPFASQATHLPDLGVHILMAALFAGSLVYLPLNTWVTRTWVHWPRNVFIWEKKRMQLLSALHHVLDPLRAIAPFRLINGYGVFPPHASPPLRIVPVLEGSADDGKSWRPYGYKHMPTAATERPPFIAPYHSRLDQWAYYMGNGIHSGSIFGSLLPYGNPYFVYTRSSWLDLIAQRLLAGDPVTKRAFGNDPFPTDPPGLIRISVLALTPTSVRDMQDTGHWWHVRRLGTLAPPRARTSWPDRYILPEPELFHPDYVKLKRRAPALRAVTEAFARGASAAESAVTGSDLCVADVEAFFGELVPLIAEQRNDWSRIHERAEVIGKRFDVDAIHRHERVLERLAWLLRLRTEAFHLGRATPRIVLTSNFRYHMLLHEMVVDGREAYEAALRDPTRAAARARSSDDASQLWTLALMRYEQMMAHVAAFRWCEIGLRGHEQGLPGLFEYYDFLVKQRPPEEDFCPEPIKHADGEHTIEGFYPPPPLRA